MRKLKRQTTRHLMQQRARTSLALVSKTRAKIPFVLGHNTYVLAAIAANGGVVRQTDIYTSLGESATRVASVDAKRAGMLRTFRVTTKQGPGPRAMAITFDETFPLANEVLALAKKIANVFPVPFDNKMPRETPPRPSSGSHDIDQIAGTEVNTLVLATVRALRGKAGRVELEASVPYHSSTAVERSVARLREYGILDGGNGTPIQFKNAAWKPQLERLYDAYLRLRPEIGKEIRARAKLKSERKRDRNVIGLFGQNQMERALTALAINGPMPRTELSSRVMLTHDHEIFDSLVEAGIVAIEKRRAARAQVWVGLNAACPIYAALRSTLLALAGERRKTVAEISEVRNDWNLLALFDTAPLFWALLMINAVRDRELDVASLNRLRGEHAKFTLHGRMHWLLDQGFVTVRRGGHMLYYRLNTKHRAYKSLKRLLDRIGKVRPDMIEAAAFNDDLKDERRLKEDRNARRRKKAQST